MMLTVLRLGLVAALLLGLLLRPRDFIEGNNKSGNHKGNPGWSGPPLPDGQVCLP